MQKRTDVTFDFIGLHGCASHCRARLFDGGTLVVILTELSDNDGTSVTNAVEYIAAQVCDFYKLDGKDVVWIEHYPDARTPRERASGARDEMFEEHFSTVNFGKIEQIGGDWSFRVPRWAPLDVVQVETLIGEQWKTETDPVI